MMLKNCARFFNFQMKNILSLLISVKNLLRSWQFRRVKGGDMGTKKYWFPSPLFWFDRTVSLTVLCSVIPYSHTETRLFCCVLPRSEVLCFFYFELWLIIRQLPMACSFDESRSLELKGTITIVIIKLFSLYFRWNNFKSYSKTAFFKAHATWCCSVDQELSNVVNFGFWDIW